MIYDTYTEKVYSGILGKIIGVYLGRPIENWTFDKISSKFGQIDYYVHKELSFPLVVTDDDIAGTITFLRSFPDYDNNPDLSPYQIGQTWLNYLVENKSVLWWGGMGNSTEHTAYLRLKAGIHAPKSGSLEINGKIISEQIGSQIFIDGWAMLCPGDPERAVDYARRAASVSHDGEAIYCAQIMAAMEAMAFTETDLQKILDNAVVLIPSDSVTYKMINDLRNWHNQLNDWKDARKKIVENYGYDKYLGNCHVIPNHALIQLGLLYGNDNFQKSLMITNTSGWDTDCNSGNVGCFLGIKNGLTTINQGPDWRGPVADRIFLSTADGGRCISDAVHESFRIINIQRALKKQEPMIIKNGARFNVEFPGSVQGFQVKKTLRFTGKCSLRNTNGHSLQGSRSLEIQFSSLLGDHVIEASTPTFILPEEMDMPGYTLMASPTVYSGQIIKSGIQADSTNNHPIKISLNISIYQDNDLWSKTANG
jgi:ADP-ribosylglycohydrolase